MPNEDGTLTQDEMSDIDQNRKILGLTPSPGRGQKAMWHLNQAISMAAEALSEATSTEEYQLMEDARVNVARKTWDALRLMVPIALAATDATGQALTDLADVMGQAESTPTP